MSAYILILTFSLKVANAGMGGVSMQEFSSLESCQNAASKWELTLPSDDSFYKSMKVSAICVKK